VFKNSFLHDRVLCGPGGYVINTCWSVQLSLTSVILSPPLFPFGALHGYRGLAVKVNWKLSKSGVEDMVGGGYHYRHVPSFL
jgi:hypothetical protein